MFYSQFILAKKGPLGTIWIAAHLERKLRKNQVADTDIGVSVDSILFPEVPIALRLSSHLLLGVVRIYNKKVNYLFDDCSETLLKIKQAFRSTTVDLPPEESKAPYHSITLPETFDLDDFELPVNDIFQGNYVDHHVISREQITLHDTMDGVSYSTSKFGLDERFGDGDTSRLDLDEELFMDKTGTAGYATESVDPQASIGSMTPFKQDEHPEGRTVILDTMADGVHEYVDLMDDAQAPCTPVLVEEPNLSNVQEASACDDHLESEYHLTESARRKNAKNVTYEEKEEVDWCSHDDTCPNSVPQMLPDNGYPSGCLEIEEARQVKDSSVEANSKHTLLKETTSPSESRSDVLDQVEYHHDDQGLNEIDLGKTAGGISGLSRTCQQVSGGLSAQDLATFGVELPGCLGISGDPEKSCPDASELVLKNQGNDCCKTDSSEQNLKENHVLEPTSCKDIHAAFSETDGQVKDKNLKDSLVDVVLPAPEKLLSLQDGHADLYRDVLVECSPRNFEGLGEGDAGSKIVTGKKRSFSERTLTEQSLNSVESSRVVRVKRTAESVPDDDDLLSSILVGRRSSILKVKPTPPLSEIIFSKPSRSAPRAPKRKVLMDTTMVLHGDTIRQQLTSTEDIRRLRKKAPCTRPEISMIQKQYLEDEIFLEAIFTGMAIELDSLHCQVYDFNGIRVCQNDTNDTSLEIVSKPRLTSQNDDNSVSLETMAELELACHDEKNITSLETVAEPRITSRNDENGANQNIENDKGSSATEQNGRGVNMELLLVRDNVIASPSENPLLSENGMDEVDTMSTEVKFSQKQLNLTIDMVPVVPQQELLQDVSEVETSQEDADSINPAVISVDESLPFIRKTLRDIGDASCGIVHPASLNETGERNSFVNVDSPAVLPDHKFDVSLAELNSMVVDVNNGQEMDRDDVTGKDGIINVEGKTELRARDDILSDVAQEGVAVQLQPNESEIYDSISGEQQIVGSSFPAQVGTQEDGFMYNKGQNSEQSEAYELNMVDAGISGLDLKDQDELHYLASGNDTGFLNVDDDELTEIADDCLPVAEETQFTENSGWSSRTMLVSKYLQSLFVKEAERGRKSLSLDLLLIGKSRKEASRMFFEALVLKTRDYVHVEQRNPFDDITIKPQLRMMKSGF